MHHPSLLNGAPEALQVVFATRPFATIRCIRRALGNKPRSLQVIAADAGVQLAYARRSLERLASDSLALSKGKNHYIRHGGTRTLLDGDLPPEIGRQILSCLTEPRRAKDIAHIVNRPPSVTTGHLRHLLKRGLVTRVSKGVYALPSRVGSASSVGAGKDRAPRAEQARTPELIQVRVWVPTSRREDLLQQAERLRQDAQAGQCGGPPRARSTGEPVDVAAGRA